MLAFFGAKATDVLAVAAHIEERRGDLPIERVVLRDAQVREGVNVAVAAFELGRFTGTERCLGFGLERHAGEADEEQHDRDVHDVAAVAASIARQQLDDGERRGFTVLPVPRARAAREFLKDRPEHEGTEAEGEQRTQVAHSGDEQYQEREHADGDRHRELPAKIRGRRPAPGNEGTDPRQEQEHQAERDVDEVEGRRAVRDLDPLYPFGNDRVQRAPQDRKREADEEQIVEEEACLAAHDRLERCLGLEQG